jgi:flavin-dependent dehydrogenase
MNAQYDVVVVGAGPAGAATARRLAQSGCRVALLEQSAFDEARVGESLAPAVQAPLMALGVWESFIALNPLPSFGTRSAWGSEEAGEHSHLMTPYLTGWHVDRVKVDAMLAAAAANAGADLRQNVRVRGCIRQMDGIFQLPLIDPRTRAALAPMTAGAVIDATGRKAALARACKARHRIFDRLVGVAVEFADEHARDRCYTHVEATADGWWYAAPIAEHRSIAMLMCDADLVRAHDYDRLDPWLGALSRAPLSRERIAGANLTWGPRIFSAVSQRLIRSAESPDRWLAVGDAALAVDPISGSGVLRALHMAEAASGALLASFNGDESAIGKYETERNVDCTSYLLERASYYSYEQRWTCSPFWQRRVSVLARAMALA